ncbi:Uncharacterised protein (plasmid) [Mesomycoplasma conjunctivae]|uniref:Uncharacterized protein n=1 Tax=Mycoplasmopsis fermentans (strain M64) TaxID=943945 RepID=A0AB32XB66_MYCFM|nr:Hypothetical Protein MfeM64YM_0211 [Mycoplasmopsis fermentans M64]RMX36037.1 hypothetical protein MFI2_0182 [Mycoplasmopsis fermentans MF-I2]VEU60244.1 Uncharacterised protein [Mycoplasmopsis fermentans]VEU67710.1 Uncharacterised protein [Mesomycoplasma conjunctivae]
MKKFVANFVLNNWGGLSSNPAFSNKYVEFIYQK